MSPPSEGPAYPHLVTPQRRAMKKTPRHWYRIAVGECPVCGKDAGYRKRIAGKPPKDRKQRYIYLSQSASYCGCLRG